MKIQEKERRAPKSKRPARPQQEAPKRQPAAPKIPTDAAEDVYIPEKETREAHNRPARSADGAAPRARTARPQERRSAPAKRAPAAKKQKNQDTQYHPYQKANAAQKQKRNQDLSLNIRRFFSYQNPVAKIFYKEDPAVFGDDPAAARRAKRAAELEKKRKRERLNTPATMYIQPAAFNSRRLAIQMMTILAVVLALVLGMSVFFRVKRITVSGTQAYSEWNVRSASGINEGDNLLTFGRTKACGQIIANLPYVKSARIGIKLPDTVNIEIEETPVVYSIQDQDSVWWLINSNGKVVEQTSIVNAKNYTQVLGVALYMPQVGEAGVAAEAAPMETDDGGEVVPVLITGAQRLNSALQILQALEANDIVGSAASVDVGQLQDIILWYGTQYQVNLGTIDKIAYKITYMKNAILQMSDYQTGILDVSFTTWPDTAGYTPFG